MDKAQPKGRIILRLKQGEACPSCHQILYIEPMGTLIDGVSFIHVRCKCRRWRIREIIFEERQASEPD